MEINDPAVKQRILPALTSISTALCRCVVPLFREIAGVPDQRGCGFLVHDGTQHYVLSAAHVLREAREGTMFLSVGGNRIKRLTGRLLLTPESDDSIDLGVVLLTGKDLPPYPAVEKQPIPLSALLGNLRGEDQSLYLFVGFPGSKGGRTGSPGDFAFQPYSYANSEAPPSLYEQVGADRSTHLVLTFNQKKAIGPEGHVQAFPHPYGMSGSPVWLLAADLPQIPVVGIATRWKKKHRVVIATDVAAALPMIQHLRAGMA